jgi:hypothetical protein
LPAAADVDARDVYCLRPTPENGVLVNTGSRCSNRPESTGAHSPTVTVTSEQDALVITGSDP